MNSFQVSVAAEAIAAAQFARCGFDISVQYGANQPEYDLIVARGDRLLKVSVKGSQDGSWGLAQSQLSKLRNANYHGAIDEWLKRHGSRIELEMKMVVDLIELRDWKDGNGKLIKKFVEVPTRTIAIYTRRSGCLRRVWHYSALIAHASCSV